MQDPHCSQLGHITGSLRPECNPYEHFDKKGGDGDFDGHEDEMGSNEPPL